MYILDIGRCKQVGAALREFFWAVRPATSTVEVRQWFAWDILLKSARRAGRSATPDSTLF